VAKPELGTKRIDPETGRKFYDLNKDPIVSPYTGKSLPALLLRRSGSASAASWKRPRKPTPRRSTPRRMLPEVDVAGGGRRRGEGRRRPPDLDDDEEDVDLGDDDDDTFLADEEEEDDDVADMIGVGDDEDEV
jgi:uncharacterized protein (TIGR02300 family)